MCIRDRALAYARVHNLNTVNSELVNKILDDYFEWNLNYVYEIWEDLIEKPGIPLSLRAKYRDIVRILRRHELDVSEETIISEAETEAGIKPYETKKRLKEMENEGLIYSPLPGRYRLVPLL